MANDWGSGQRRVLLLAVKLFVYHGDYVQVRYAWAEKTKAEVTRQVYCIRGLDASVIRAILLATFCQLEQDNNACCSTRC